MVEGFHGLKINLRILALIGYCCHKPKAGNNTSPRISGTVLNSPRLKGAIQGPKDWQGKCILVPGRGLLRFSATVVLAVSKVLRPRPFLHRLAPEKEQDSTCSHYPETEVGR